MANLIDKVVVNGTEYEIVNDGGEYPVVVFADDIHDHHYPDESVCVSGDVTPTFKFVRIERNGEYDYRLAMITNDPGTYTYSETSPC